jgi:hypothetical protein
MSTMTNAPKILAFAAVLVMHPQPTKHLVKIAADGARQQAQKSLSIDLRDLPMPLFDEDLEAKEGIPANVTTFKQLMIAHQGLLIAAPSTIAQLHHS